MPDDVLDPQVTTGAGSVPLIPVGLIVAGSYLAWFGVHYWRSDTKWPTDPIKAVLTGKPIPAPSTAGAQSAAQAIAQAAAGGNAVGQGAAAVGSAVAAGSGGAGGLLTGPGQSLDHTQLMTLWTGNGGNPATADVAAAVGMAESTGRPWVTSSNPDGGTNVGLWQLDTEGEGAGYTVAQLQDPTTNARVTVLQTKNGTDWSHWQTYVDGTYKQFL